MKVYEAKKDLCRICNVKQSILLPYCLINGNIKVFPVCNECRDKVPYETIPVIVTMDKGYYFCPHKPEINEQIEI